VACCSGAQQGVAREKWPLARAGGSGIEAKKGVSFTYPLRLHGGFLSSQFLFLMVAFQQK
jgi:hypothetical protein